MAQEVAEMDRDAGHGTESAQIKLLPRRLVRIVRPGGHQCREVFDFRDGVFWKEQLAKLADVDPPIGGLFQGSVVEIEAVNINVRDYTRLQKCKSRLGGGFAPGHRSDRGDIHQS